jgi:hypothetical protein
MIRNILKHFSLFVLFNSLNEQLTNNINNNNNSNKKKKKTASFRFIIPAKLMNQNEMK